MNLNELAKKAHSNAVEHGFWEQRWTHQHCLMLVITEIAELVEAHRNTRTADMDAFTKYEDRLSFDVNFATHVKDTIQDEFADIAIRLFDLAGALGIDFDVMYPCQYHRDYDKFTFTENAFALVKGLTKENISVEKRVQFALAYVTNWTESLSIGLPWHVDAKMKYNEHRAIRHGKKY